jgi:hypothetical protein
VKRGLALVSLAFACRAPAAQLPSNETDPAPIQLIEVPATGEAVAFKRNPEAGAQFLLKAQGAIVLGNHQIDAEYTETGDDVVDGLDVGVDIGRKQIVPARGRIESPPSDRRVKWFGAFRPDHTHHLLFTGDGEILAPRFIAPRNTGGGAGSITVALYRLPVFKRLWETVMVPARAKVPVQSGLTGASGTTYLLQALGEVQVGGPGHMGDAEFHDYKPDGRGHNEGESGVDFGVGVDEPMIGVGKGNDPRQRKWGSFRIDHSYYMLYTGTGRRIVLDYHDTGGRSGVFKDNAGFLPVNIWAIP